MSKVQTPALASDTLVLIVGDDTVSYLVPIMDPSARWLSLDINFLNPTQDIAHLRTAENCRRRRSLSSG